MDRTFHDLQFGLIENRGNNMTVSLTNDVINYVFRVASSVIACSLDAEITFDSISYSVLFPKTLDIIFMHCWHILMSWYHELIV